ncbi:Protein ste50 [Steccherinum ochraceum]|uniref:Protein ste50 n=1 Tax=Steccherinum ochraceum TaxID=92696 RepID=A0A4R0RGP3_9APHY|nr:Protein ste50 [Steccherinum ochraceum]
MQHSVPIEADDYVPPSEVEERQENISVDKLYNLMKDQADRLRQLEEENRRLHDSMSSCLEDISSLRASQVRPTEAESSPVTRQSSFKWASFVKPSRSPTKPIPEVVTSPQPSPQRTEYEFANNSNRADPPSSSSSSDKSRPSMTTTLPSFSTNSLSTASSSTIHAPPRPQRQESSDNLKSFKVSLDDPAWKVLPAALKKYKINNDDWQNYAMFICYGYPGNRIERCLSYDEKPLLLFQKLKDAKKNPVFMLKHIKDIRSPIAVAQQKQAARKANSETSSVKSPPLSGASGSSLGIGQASGQLHGSGRGRALHLQVNSHVSNVAPGMMSGVPGGSGQSSWPEIMSPSVETKDRSAEDITGVAGDLSKGSLAPGSSNGTEDSIVPSVVREIPPSTGVSYAVAIYPYMAEQEDEFDVVVGDTFLILSRARGWWVVQRDPEGSGLVEPDMSKQGWVPAGCLLETNVPVASAIAEATARGHSDSPPTTPGGTTKTPILPLSILSTSFPGIALMDYKKKGEEELDLMKDDQLRVFKRYNHWSYAVKEESGDRGWVPSWFIGKVPTTSGVPMTPSTSGAPISNQLGSATVSLDAGFSGDVPGPVNGQPAQVSPMSSAFPPMATRTTAVI